MREPIKGTMERVPVEVERFDVRISRDHAEDYQNDPEGFMRRFLEEQGHTVNRVVFVSSRPSGVGRSAAAEATEEPEGPEELRMVDTTFHVVLPPESASGWICAEGGLI